MGPAPYSAMLLADLGAEVICIDRPPTMEVIGMDPRSNLLNRDKRSIAVDLRHPEAQGLVLELLGSCDVLIEGYRPGVMEKLWLGPTECLAANPRLVYGRMTGWGQDGPYASMAGHDIDYVAVTGVLHAMGSAGGPPAVPLNLVGDLGGGGSFMVIGVFAALHEVAATGLGQVIDAAIVDGSTHLLSVVHSLMNAGRWIDERGMNLLDGGAPYYSTYRRLDGEYLALGAIEPKFFAELLRITGVEFEVRDQNDRARGSELRQELERQSAHAHGRSGCTCSRERMPASHPCCRSGMR